jgi:predicted amidohydrolase YtcJ
VLRLYTTADLTVLSDDVLTVPEEAVKELKATMTIVGGRIVFQR